VADPLHQAERRKESLLVVPVVAKDENSRQPITVCPGQDSKRAEVTPKGFEEVIGLRRLQENSS